MVNMCNCNLEKTADDLLECYKHMAGQILGSEETAKRKLIRLCKQISEEFGGSKDIAESNFFWPKR